MQEYENRQSTEINEDTSIHDTHHVQQPLKMPKNIDLLVKHYKQPIKDVHLLRKNMHSKSYKYCANENCIDFGKILDKHTNICEKCCQQYC